MHIHRSLRSALCFSSCMKFSFRGHSCGFTPCTGIHFPSLGLNRAGHDTSLTMVSWSPGIILVLMYSQFVQKWYMLIQVSSLLAISRYDVVHCLSDVLCLVPIRMARLNILRIRRVRKSKTGRSGEGFVAPEKNLGQTFLDCLHTQMTI